MMKQNKLGMFTAIICSLTLLYVIFFASEKLFLSIGAVGGCVYLIDLFIRSGFPNEFNDKKKLKNEKRK